MQPFLGGAIAALVLASPSLAQDFAAGSAAKPWGLLGEQPARFEAEVVDVLCALAGDCPPDCGGGARQLGLLRSADDVLVLPMKNAESVFSGAVADLVPYCGQVIEVDGLMVGEAEAAPTQFYMVQRIRPEGETAFLPATQFSEAWSRRHPEAAAAEGPWFRKDPDVAAQIARDGYLGLGPAADAAFIAEWF